MILFTEEFQRKGSVYGNCPGLPGQTSAHAEVGAGQTALSPSLSTMTALTAGSVNNN